MLLEQLRERAATADIMTSVQRLCTLAHVGSVTITTAVLHDALRVEAAAAGARLLDEVMQAHGIEAIDIAATMTDAEFLKLGGILVAPPSSVRGAIVDTAEALSIWNVRLRAYGATLRPTPAGMHGMRAIEPPAAEPVVPFSQGTVGSHPTLQVDYTTEPALEEAVARGDGDTVYGLLRTVDEPSRFTRLATANALQLVVEQLLEQKAEYDVVHALLVRGGIAGARAVFDQLIAATEVADRRFLYDLAASLPATVPVAQQYASHPTWYVARNAAGLLGQSKSQQAIPELSRLLRHGDTRVRVAAVVALGQIGGPAATARLESVLFDSVPDVRNRALSIVFAAPDADPLADRMMLAVQEESTLEYQLEVIAALANVHTPRARQKLIELTAERSRSLEDLQIRLAAIGALGAGHRPDADAVLRRLATDEHGVVRERAQSVLGG